MLTKHQRIRAHADGGAIYTLSGLVSFVFALSLLGACHFDTTVPPVAPDDDRCGGACAADEVCSANGTCESTCAADTTDCNGLCIDTGNDPAHCGGCGNACAINEVCNGSGACQMCSSERLWPIACTTSAPGEVGGCEELYDAVEFASSPELTGLDSVLCHEAGGSSFCVYDNDCVSGCIRDLWIRFDLGTSRPVHRIRYIANWWAKRPDKWELWVTDDPAMTPDDGAALAIAGVGEPNPWACADGESCADTSVPDACCPDGRDQPQNLVNVGQYWPRFDELEFPELSGRYWYYLVKDTRDTNHLLLNEIELFGTNCP